MQKGAGPVWTNPFYFLEAASGFEPLYNGFADRSLATWVCRLGNHNYLLENRRQVKLQCKGRISRLAPRRKTLSPGPV
jgi:hypothetical protein